MLNFAKTFTSVYDNTLDAFVPQLWANESILILQENMVAAQLVHRDFEPLVAQFGDTVNTRKPGEFVAQRKTNADGVLVQDATATNVAVPLNQQIHVAFMLKDGEESKSFKNLVEEYLRPAMLAQARILDRIVLGQYSQFLPNAVGSLGTLSGTNAKAQMLAVRKQLNKTKAYPEGRNLIWTTNAEAEVLNTDIFIQANTVGDDGTAMREASLGRKLGFDNYQCQNMASVSAGSTTTTGAINNGAGYLAGTTTFTVDVFSNAVPNNSWITVAGDMLPLRVVSTVGGGTPTSITVTSPGLGSSVVDDAVVTSYSAGSVNNSGGYASGYSKYIAYTFTVDPQIGQFVTFGTDPTSPIYTIIDVDGTNNMLLLDRPLEVALTNGEAINPGPAGEYNFAFHRNCLSLVVRPLALPRTGTGAIAAVVNFNGLSMRATITYQGLNQGHLVVLDMLCGVKVLDTNLGAVLCG